MFISKLHLINWRNFKTVDIPLEERMFIVGPNASGKSNLLDVFRFLKDIAKPDGGLQKAVMKRGGLSKIRNLSARKSAQVEIEVGLTDTKNKNHWLPHAGNQREDQFSDGMLRLVGLLWSLLETETLLLLEEPELSLHDSVVEKLPPLMA